MQTVEAQGFDACWQRIGVQGDRTCEKLAAHVHCRNCERHAEAAVLLLDRYTLQLQDAGGGRAEAAPVAATALRPALLFRVGQDWLALDPARLMEVAPTSAIHSLPHRRNRVLLGVCNVRGVLVPALALGPLLGLEATVAAAGPGARPRHLILDAAGGALVLPVDEVDGVQAIPEDLLMPAHKSSSLAVSRLAQYAFQWRQGSVTWLDAQRLAQTLQESLG